MTNDRCQRAHEAECSVNTDRELWRETPGDAFSPRLFVTKSGGVGIEVGGHVFVMPVREWHTLAFADAEAGRVDERQRMISASLEAQLIDQRSIGYGEGQRDAIADVNAGRIDDLIAPRLQELQVRLASLTTERDRETDLRREAEHHNSELVLALEEKPFADEYETLEQKLARVMVALEKYGQHDEPCPCYYGTRVEPCTCGLEATLKETDES